MKLVLTIYSALVSIASPGFAWEYANLTDVKKSFLEGDPDLGSGPDEVTMQEKPTKVLSNGISVIITQVGSTRSLGRGAVTSTYLVAKSALGLDATYLGDCYSDWKYLPVGGRSPYNISEYPLAGKVVVTFEKIVMENHPNPRRYLEVWIMYPWGMAKSTEPILIDEPLVDGSTVKAKPFTGFSISEAGLTCKLPGSSRDSVFPFARSSSDIKNPSAILKRTSAAFKSGGALGASKFIEKEVGSGEWKISSSHVELFNNFGYYLEQSSQNEFAIFILNQVVSQYPDRTVAYLNLADAYSKSGNRESAKKNYSKYCDLMTKSGKANKIPARAKG